jgi:hypothetical protein
VYWPFWQEKSISSLFLRQILSVLIPAHERYRFKFCLSLRPQDMYFYQSPYRTICKSMVAYDITLPYLPPSISSANEQEARAKSSNLCCGDLSSKSEVSALELL